MCEALSELSPAIVFEEVEVVKLVACDNLSISCAVTDHLNFVIESHDADPALLSTVCHIINLRIYGTLDALHARDVGPVSISLIDKLIGAIAKFLDLSDQFFQFVALELVLALNWLSDAHRARCVNAKDDRDILSAKHCVAVLNLG